MNTWQRSSVPQRAGIVLFVVAFGTFVIGATARGDRAAATDRWLDILLIALALGIPAGAIAISWWVDTTTGANRTPVSRRLVIPLGLGFTFLTRAVDRRAEGGLILGLFVWWAIAAAIMLFVIPRLTSKS